MRTENKKCVGTFRTPCTSLVKGIFIYCFKDTMTEGYHENTANQDSNESVNNSTSLYYHSKL